MSVFIVSYELRTNDSDYYNYFYSRLGLWGAIRLLDNVWAINTTVTASELRGDLYSQMHAGDGLMVVETDHAVWSGLADQSSQALTRWITPS